MERVSTYKILGVFIVILTTYLKELARSFTLYVFYVEPALTKLAC